MKNTMKNTMKNITKNIATNITANTRTNTTPATLARSQKLALALALVGVTGSAACRPQNPLAAVVPGRAQVRLNVPGAADDSGQALRVGDTSEFYATTVHIADGINGGVGGVFRLVEDILALPPTDTDGETYAVWGPSQPEGLQRNSFRFTVNKVADGEFDYVLQARPKDATDDAAFVAVFEGTAFPSGDGDRGHGELDIHWGALRSLDDTQCMIGDLHIDYAGDAEPRTLDVTFAEAADGCRDEAPTNATYHYEDTEDGAGVLRFSRLQNIHRAAENKPLEETLDIRSRWTADGAGRSDVRLSGGEIPADLAAGIPGTTAVSADVVECWDSSFAVVASDMAPDELEAHLGRTPAGDVAQCAFTDSAFADDT
jgi:hypothetical protein